MSAYAQSKASVGSIPVTDDQERDFHKLARITMVEAIEVALAAVPGKAVEADLDDHKGHLVYEIEVIKDDGRRVKFRVDAGDKRILQQTER